MAVTPAEPEGASGGVPPRVAGSLAQGLRIPLRSQDVSEPTGPMSGGEWAIEFFTRARVAASANAG